MKSLNKIQLIGRVGSQPEIKSVNGKKVANLSLATSWGTGDKEKTEWHRLNAWEKVAEVFEKYVNKGDPIYVEGEVNYREWEKDGVKQRSTEIRVFNVIMLGGKSEPAKAAATASNTGTTYGDDFGPDFGDEPLPF